MHHPNNLEVLLLRQLENSGDVSSTELQRAHKAAAATDKRLDEALIELGLLSEDRLIGSILDDLGVQVQPLENLPQKPIMENELQADYLRRYEMVPVAASNDTLTLAMVNPYDDFAATAVALKTDRRVLRMRIDRAAFESAFETAYGDIADENTLDQELAPSADPDGSDVEILKDSASDAPVIRFVQDMIRRAVSVEASDIHLKPHQSGANLSFRVDGILVAQDPPARQWVSGIISRLKLLANLDISERRLPQDGRIRMAVAGQSVDLRLSTMPQIHGEGIVIRLLEREVHRTTLNDLGFSPSVRDRIGQMFGFTEGLVLVTGPTGSGKSTTLYAALKQLVRPDLNVVTIEDPVEYRLDGISQIQVDEKAGLTFPRVLRSLLRQDPDIILIGEIRDSETARIAVQAALTGHLVLATLHTNSAMAAVSRLLDMGVERYLLPAVLRGVLAQRLLRSLCPECSVDDGNGHRTASKGCENCSNTGYRGRTAVGEVLLLDQSLCEDICSAQDLRVLEPNLRRTGFVPIREDATAKIDSGKVDVLETLRVLDVGS